MDLRSKTFDLKRLVVLLGIVNVTPDSFSDGGRFLDPDRAAEHARRLVAEGAHWLDLGAESTRPGAAPVPPAEQLARLLPVVRALRSDRAFDTVPLSIDTQSAEVLAGCLEAGADLLNDVSALRADPDMLRVAAEARCPVIAMHMLDEPRTMQAAPRYDDVVLEVLSFFRDRLAALERAGVDPERVLVDPGIGFGKTLEHNLELLRRLPELGSLGRPLVIGVSRKSSLGALSGEIAPEDRALESVVAAILAVERGARVLRVHDVAEHRRALAVAAPLVGTLPVN